MEGLNSSLCYSIIAYHRWILLCEFLMMMLAAIGVKGADKPTIVPSPDVITYCGGEIYINATKPDDAMEVAWETTLLQSFVFSSNSDLRVQVNDVSHNRSLIYCIARHPSQPTKFYYSTPTRILIQDILSHVELSRVDIGFCTAVISWNPPFSLSGVPILGYNVNITNLDTGDATTIFIKDTNITVPLDYNYNISVAGINIVGEGNSSTITTSSVFNTLNSVFSKLRFTDYYLSRNKRQWEINVPLFGYEQQHEEILNDARCNAFFAFHFEHTSTKMMYLSNKTHLNGSVLGNDPIEIPEKAFYYINVSLYAFQRQLLVYTLNVTMLSTFDLQGIRNQFHSNGSISLYAEYVKGAISNEFGVQIVCLNTSHSTNYTFTEEKLLHKDDVLGNATCLLQGYDIDSFTNSWKGPAVNKTITFNKTLEGVANDEVPNSPTHSTARPENFGVIVAIAISTALVLASLVVMLVILALKIGPKSNRRTNYCQLK